MRHEFNNGVIYIYDENNECIIRQSHDPRDSTLIEDEIKAKEVANLIIGIKEEEKKQEEEQKAESERLAEELKQKEKPLTDREKIVQLEEYVSDIFSLLVYSNTATVDEIPEKIRDDVTETLKKKEADANIVHNYKI